MTLKRNRFLPYLLCASIVVGWYATAVLPAHAATITWTDASSTNLWSNGGNWSGGVAPGAGDTALFSSSSTANATINANINVGGIDIVSGYTGIINASTSNVTVGSSGFTEAAGTWVGESGTASTTVTGNYTLTGGSFTAPSSTLVLQGVSNTFASSSFFAPTGTVIFDATTTLITGSSTLYNLSFENPQTASAYSTSTIATGTVLTVAGTLNLSVGTPSCNSFCSFPSFYGGEIAAQGNIQDSAVNGYYVGNTYNPGTTLIELTGNNNQTIGTSQTSVVFPSNFTINKSGGTVSLVGVSFGGIYFPLNTTWNNLSSSTINPGTSTVIFSVPNATLPDAFSISGLASFYNLVFNCVSADGEASDTVADILSTVTVSNIFYPSGECIYTGTGALDVSGNISGTGAGASSPIASSSFPITLTGTSTQYLGGIEDPFDQGIGTNVPLPGLTIANASDTVVLGGRYIIVYADGTWTNIIGATIVPGTSTVEFQGAYALGSSPTSTDTIVGSSTFYNLLVSNSSDYSENNYGDNMQLNVPTTTTVTVQNNLIWNAQGSWINMIGGGTLDVAGNIDGGSGRSEDGVNNNTSTPQSGTIVLNGTSTQIINATSSYSSSPNFEPWNLVINKPSGLAVMQADDTSGFLGIDNNLTVQQGELQISGDEDGNPQSLTIDGTLTVDPGSTFSNYPNVSSTIEFTGVVNNGTISMDSGGSSCGAGLPDYAIIRSAFSPTKVPWSGTGSYSLSNVDLAYQSSTISTITAYGSKNSGNNAGFSFVGCPTVPTINSFTASPTVVASGATSTLSWNITNASSVAITPGSLNTSTLIGSFAVNPTSTTIYTLTATNAIGTSTATTSVSVATPPTAPGSLSVGSPTASSLSLSWASSTPNNGATLSFYSIHRGTSTSTMPQVATTSNISYTDTGLSASTTYFYYVTAQDSVGNISASSTIASGTTALSNPPTISSFSASPAVVALNGTSSLSWNVSNASSVTITPGGFSTSTLIGSTSTGVLSTSTTYTLTATNLNGTSTATTSVSIATVPTAPGSFSVGSPTASTLSLSWASSTPNNGATITFYSVYRGSSSTTISTFIATTTNPSYVSTGLATSATYWYDVTAEDSVGNISPSSTAQSGTTSSGQGTIIFNCSSGFNATATSPCGVAIPYEGTYTGTFKANTNSATISGTQLNMIPASTTHEATALDYQTLANVQAFSSTFTFVPNGSNVVFSLQNNNNNPGYDEADFSGGAGCEGGFYQAFGADAPPNNIFGLELDSYSYLNSNPTFTYSSAQIYQMAQSPCNPNDSGPEYWLTNKISTYPVPLNSPSSTQGSTTGDTYSATVDYTGTNFVLNMYDVTAGGSCPGATCFTYTWPVNIPSLVGSTTAYVMLTGAVGEESQYPLNINSWIYAVLSPASTPTFSPTAGTYAGTQSVTISDASPGSIICYNMTGAPATNGSTGCTNGTLYTGAISVPSGQTIYAVAGGTGYGDSSVGSAAYQIGSTASQPTFSPASGTYEGTQTVFLTAAQGRVICYSTATAPATNGSNGCTTGTLYSGPITVATNTTLYAAAGGSGFTDSHLGSSTYVISPFSAGTGAPPANSPTYSPSPGTYGSAQTVTLATSSASSYICYTLAASPPTLTPQTDNEGGCIVGTLYSGPVTVSSSETLYAMASTPYLGPPSSLTEGTYDITGSSTPTISSFNPSPTSINIGSSTQLSWNVSNASSVTLSGNNLSLSTSTASGNVSVTPNATGTLIYTLSANNANGTSTATTSVTVSTPDTTPPVVVWISPALNATVSSTVTLQASSTDNVAVSSVAFYEGSIGAALASSTLIGSTSTASNNVYSLPWNTTSFANGSTTLWALSTDTSNNTSSVSSTVNVENPPILSVTTSTSLAYTAAQGATATSSQNVVVKNTGPLNSNFSWSASSTQTWLTFSSSSGSLASNASTSVLFNVNPAGQGIGTYNATATITAAGAIGSPKALAVSLTVTATGVSVSITAPANGATVSSTISVTAVPTSTVGIASVQFFLDGTPLGSLLVSSPYTYSWNTTGITNGSHVLVASTTDNLNNVATSSAITVTVANATTSTPPQSLTTVPHNASVSLAWSAPTSTGGSGLTQYLLYDRLTGSSTFALYATTTPSFTTSSVTSLTNGQSYDFEVLAQNAIGTSAPSDIVSSTPYTVPNPPTGVSASAGNAEATVSFTPGASNGSTILYYTAASTPGNIAASSSGSPLVVSGLTNGQAYTFTVSATNLAGASPNSSSSNSVIPSDLDPVISSFIASPNDVQPEVTSTLSWTTSNAVSVSIDHGVGSVATSSGSVVITPTSTLTYTLTATNANGTSTAQATVVIDGTPPSVPTSVVANPFSTSEIDLSWASSTDNVGVAGYDIYQGNSASTLALLATTTNLSYQNTGLSASTLYYYGITAFDGAGNISATSTVVSATTNAASSGGGGGGGGGGYYAPVTTTSTVTGVGGSSTSTPTITSCDNDIPCLEALLAQLEAELQTLLKEAATRGISVLGTSSFTRNLTVGDRGTDVTALQEILIAAGDLHITTPTTSFGLLTQAALGKYQASHGITPASGYFGPKTRAYLAGGGTTTTPIAPTSTSTTIPSAGSAAPTASLSVGDTGSAVANIQNILLEDDFLYPGTYTTGTFDFATQRAVEALQCVEGIACSDVTPGYGVVGPKTRAALGE